VTVTARPTARPLAAAALLLLLAAPPLGAQPAPQTAMPARPAAEAAPKVHPFYVRLLDDGVYAFQQGDAEKAATDLRLAVFGMLEAPDRLAHGLSYLALAEADAGEEEKVRDTLGRLIAVSDSFAAGPEPPLPDAVSARLEELMLAAVPEATLTGSATFGGLADEKFVLRLAALPPRERRAALAEKAAAEPDDPRWALALGELDLENGRAAEAARQAAQVLAATPDDLRGHCLAGLAGAALGTCQPAVASLERCPRSRNEAAVAAAWVGCLVELERWREAQAALDTLAPALRAERQLSRLAERVGRQVSRLPTSTPAAAPVPDTPPADTALPPAAEADLRRARELLAGARRQSELTEPLRLAAGVADAYPGSSEAQYLAGEIAYRASRWDEAARYLRRSGEPERPELRFYLAVSLFESGDRTAASEVLERALPGLPRSPFVNSYVERILGDGAP
jgi:tetratricopeptide (TPR) repeat protein